MPRLLLIVPTLLLAVSLTLLVPTWAQPGGQAPPATPAPAAEAAERANAEEVVDLEQVPNAPRDAISYALGYRMGYDLRQNAFEVQIEDFTAGLRDAVVGDGEPRISEEQLMASLMAFQQHMQAQQQERLEAFAQENRDFLEDNAQRDEVEVTASGLQYRVIEAGPADGPRPEPGQQVRVDYEGRLIDDRLFDASHLHGGPAQFSVGGVIEGWNEALQLMTPGSKWELFIPAELAYGSRGTDRIPPHATLIFEVELLEIVE